MQSPLFRTALTLGLLSTVGPFAIDMFLPALPDIARDLGSTESEAQITLTAYFAAFGIAQLIYGPWADQSGRKRPLYVGLVIFLIGSLGCAVAPNMAVLALFRMLQGLGAAALGVVPRAIIRDMYTGAEATRLMALVMLVISVSPMLAPLSGSAVLAVWEWRAVFWLLLGAGVLSLAALAFMQKETLPAEKRVPVNLRSLWHGAGVLLRDPVFMGLTFIGAFGFATFFIFIANASFVYTREFGLSPTQFSLAFAANAIGFFLSSQFAAPLGMKFGMVPVMRWAVFGFFVLTTLLALLTLLTGGSLLLIMGMLFLANACLGLIIPATMVMALDQHGDIAGLASSLGGAMQMIFGGLAVVVLGLFDIGAVSMVVGIATSATAAFVLSLTVMGRVAQAA